MDTNRITRASVFRTETPTGRSATHGNFLSSLAKLFSRVASKPIGCEILARRMFPGK